MRISKMNSPRSFALKPPRTTGLLLLVSISYLATTFHLISTVRDALTLTRTLVVTLTQLPQRNCSVSPLYLRFQDVDSLADIRVDQSESHQQFREHETLFGNAKSKDHGSIR